MVKFTKTELLIESVKMYKPIYDASDKKFKNNVTKHKCWEEISDIIGVPVSECKKRWKSLRDQYNKKKKSDLTGAELARWDYTDLMSFLAVETDTVEKRETTNTNSRDPLDGVVIEVIKSELLDEEQHSEQRHKEQHTLQQILDEDSQDVSMTTEEFAQNIRRGTIRNSREPISNLITKRDAQKSALFDNVINKCHEIKTPIQKFFESMADIVDKLPPHLQAEVRLKVCQVVTETELKHHKNLQSFS